MKVTKNVRNLLVLMAVITFAIVERMMGHTGLAVAIASTVLVEPVESFTPGTPATNQQNDQNKDVTANGGLTAPMAEIAPTLARLAELAKAPEGARGMPSTDKPKRTPQGVHVGPAMSQKLNELARAYTTIESSVENKELVKAAITTAQAVKAGETSAVQFGEFLKLSYEKWEDRLQRLFCTAIATANKEFKADFEFLPEEKTGTLFLVSDFKGLRNLGLALYGKADSAISGGAKQDKASKRLSNCIAAYKLSLEEKAEAEAAEKAATERAVALEAEKSTVVKQTLEAMAAATTPEAVKAAQDAGAEKMKAIETAQTVSLERRNDRPKTVNLNNTRNAFRAMFRDCAGRHYNVIPTSKPLYVKVADSFIQVIPGELYHRNDKGEYYATKLEILTEQEVLATSAQRTGVADSEVQAKWLKD